MAATLIETWSPTKSLQLMFCGECYIDSFLF